MSRIRTYARNLAANWIGYGANIAVAFFMTPFIVHSLGDVRYGVWSLIISVAGYMGLAEMGVRPSVGRYINLYMGRQQPDKINEVVNSAWAFFLGVGFVPVVLAGLIGWCFPFIFPRVSTEYLLEVRVVLMVLSVSLVLGFLSSTMWCVVTAHERFDLSNTVVVGVLAIRTAAIVLVLVYGGGLIGMALAIVGAEVVMLAISVVAARRVSKTLRFGRQWANWTCLKELMSYGVAAFVNATSQRIIYFASLLIIGWLLDASEVTYYSLGLMLVQYGRGLLGEVVRTMYPEIAKQSGK